MDSFGDRRAVVIEQLYELADDPLRLAELLEIWEREPPQHGFADPLIERHAGRAERLLALSEEETREDDLSVRLERIGPNPAVIVDARLAPVAWNTAAVRHWHVAADLQPSRLPFDREDLGVVSAALDSVLRGPGRKAVLVRLRNEETERGTLLRIERIRGEGAITGPLALIVGAEVVWNEQAARIIGEAFELTEAELEVLGGLVEGRSAAEIAAQRGRSTETVRTQIRALMAKSETHSRAELLRVVLALLQLVSRDGEEADPAGVTAPAESFEALVLGDGRRLAWREFGAARGRPLLYMHLDYCLAWWPEAAVAEARRRDIRVIAPLRPGYGPSDPLPAREDRLKACGRDALALMDHLRIGRFAVLTPGADLRYGLQIALQEPGRVTGIVGAAAQLPARSPVQYARMDRWQRFVLANARYAPGVLPFLVRAGVAMARRLGFREFLRMANAAAPGDLEALDDPGILQALARAAPLMLEGEGWRAFAAEALDSERDWSDLVERAPVPVRLVQGTHDPQAPAENVIETSAINPALEVEFLQGEGQFLFFRHPGRVLDRAADFLAAATPG